jgi:mono/diheme cytochrome c family protein
MKNLILAMIAGVVCGGVVSAQQTPAAQDPKLVEAGKKLYEAQKCMQCHTIEGKGGTLTKQFPLDGVASKMSADDIRRWLTHPAEMEAKLPSPPKMKMSMRKYSLTPADLDALVAYMLTLKEKK